MSTTMDSHYGDSDRSGLHQMPIPSQGTVTGLFPESLNASGEEQFSKRSVEWRKYFYEVDKTVNACSVTL